MGGRYPVASSSGGIDLVETKDTKKAYIPETFDPTSVPEWLQPYAHHIQEFCHILHHRRLQEQLSREDYVPLKTEYLRRNSARLAQNGIGLGTSSSPTS